MYKLCACAQIRAQRLSISLLFHRKRNWIVCIRSFFPNRDILKRRVDSKFSNTQYNDTIVLTYWEKNPHTTILTTATKRQFHTFTTHLCVEMEALVTFSSPRNPSWVSQRESFPPNGRISCPRTQYKQTENVTCLHTAHAVWGQVRCQ